ncbi:nad6-1, partial (mitochondrion) [Drosophila guanche]
IITYMNN